MISANNYTVDTAHRLEQLQQLQLQNTAALQSTGVVSAGQNVGRVTAGLLNTDSAQQMLERNFEQQIANAASKV